MLGLGMGLTSPAVLNNVSAPVAQVGVLLLESGDALLLESGDKLLLEG